MFSFVLAVASEMLVLLDPATSINVPLGCVVFALLAASFKRGAGVVETFFSVFVIVAPSAAVFLLALESLHGTCCTFLVFHLLQCVSLVFVILSRVCVRLLLACRRYRRVFPCSAFHHRCGQIVYSGLVVRRLAWHSQRVLAKCSLARHGSTSTSCSVEATALPMAVSVNAAGTALIAFVVTAPSRALMFSLSRSVSAHSLSRLFFGVDSSFIDCLIFCSFFHQLWAVVLTVSAYVRMSFLC